MFCEMFSYVRFDSVSSLFLSLSLSSQSNKYSFEVRFFDFIIIVIIISISIAHSIQGVFLIQLPWQEHKETTQKRKIKNKIERNETKRIRSYFVCASLWSTLMSSTMSIVLSHHFTIDALKMLLYYTFRQNIFFDWIYSSNYDWSQVAIAFHVHIFTLEQHIYIMDMALSVSLARFAYFHSCFALFLWAFVILKAYTISNKLRYRTENMWSIGRFFLQQQFQWADCCYRWKNECNTNVNEWRKNSMENSISSVQMLMQSF